MTYMDAFRSFMALLTGQKFYYIYNILAIVIMAIIDPMSLGCYVVGWMLAILLFSFIYWRLSNKYEDFYVSQN